jgi:hypothetical protein
MHPKHLRRPSEVQHRHSPTYGRCSARSQERALTATLRPRLAVRIDTENTSASHAPALVAHIARPGRASVRRTYGDWTRPQLTPRKSLLGPLAIRTSPYLCCVERTSGGGGVAGTGE